MKSQFVHGFDITHENAISYMSFTLQDDSLVITTRECHGKQEYIKIELSKSSSWENRVQFSYQTPYERITVNAINDRELTIMFLYYFNEKKDRFAEHKDIKEYPLIMEVLKAKYLVCTDVRFDMQETLRRREARMNSISDKE